MNEHKETYETFDITNAVVLAFFLILAFVCIVKRVDVSHIRFEFRTFEKHTLSGWNDLMKLAHPFDYNSKMARSTDACASKIRSKCNKK